MGLLACQAVDERRVVTWSKILQASSLDFTQGSEHLHHVFPAMIGVADQATVGQVDDQVERLQGDLPDEHGTSLAHFSDINRGHSVLDRQPNRLVHWDVDDAVRRADRPAPGWFQAQAVDQ